MKVPLVCRVCGIDFVAARFDAVTCSSTCRQRLRRGGEFAYFAGLTKRQQRLERKMHASYDDAKAAHKEAVAAGRKLRDSKRDHRRQRAEEERERIVAEIVGREVIKKQRQERREWMRRTVASVLLLFDKEQRNDCSAQAIADFIKDKLELPDDFPVEVVAELLEEVKTIHDAGKDR